MEMEEGESFQSPSSHLPVVVLHQVFKLLDYDTLKDARLVSKDWNEEATKVFKKIAICKPEWYSIPERCHNFFRDNLDMSMDVVNISITPFGPQEQSFLPPVLRHWLDKNGRKLRMIRYSNLGFGHNFLQLILPQLSSNLEEIQIIVSGRENKSALRDFNVPMLPRLKTILIRDTTLESGDQEDFSILKDLPLFSKLFQAAVNVESVNVFCDTTERSTQIVSSLVRNCGLKLKHIAWEKYWTHIDLCLLLNLSNKGIKLQTLDLDCSLLPYKIVSSMIYQLLCKHEDSLKTLKIGGELVESWSDGQHTFDVDEHNYFHPAEEVHQLHEQIDAVLKTLELHNYFPNPVPQDLYACVSFLDLKVPILRNVTTLIINDIFHLRLIGNLLSFLARFPTLKRLTLINPSYSSHVYPLRPDDVLKQLLRKDDFSDSQSSAVIQPHTSLEEFYLDGELTEVQSVRFIADGLPSLKKIQLLTHSDEVFCGVLTEFSKKLIRLSHLDLTMRGISNLCWCNDAICNWLPKMKELKNLKLLVKTEASPSSPEQQPFQLFKKTVRNGICGAAGLGWLKLTNFSFCSTKVNKMMDDLKNHCTSVELEQCVLYSPPFNISYGSWNKETNGTFPVITH